MDFLFQSPKVELGENNNNRLESNFNKIKDVCSRYSSLMQFFHEFISVLSVKYNVHFKERRRISKHELVGKIILRQPHGVCIFKSTKTTKTVTRKETFVYQRRRSLSKFFIFNIILLKNWIQIFSIPVRHQGE